MSPRRIFLLALILAASASMIPSSARADGLVFGFQHGFIGITTGIGTGILTNDPSSSPKLVAATLTSIGTTNTGNHFAGTLGTVVFTAGTALSTSSTLGRLSQVVFAPGGAIRVTSGTAIGGIGAAALLFSGTFSGNTAFTKGVLIGNKIPWMLSGKVTTTTANAALLTLLGLPPQHSGTFTALAVDVIFGLRGGGLDMGSITLAPATTVPEPGTLALFGTGMLSIVGILRRRPKK